MVFGINYSFLSTKQQCIRFVKIVTVMNTNTIRQKLHSFLEVADDKKIKAIYSMVEAEIEDSSEDYSAELKAELDKRNDNYKLNQSKIITPKESKERIRTILSKARENEL